MQVRLRNLLQQRKRHEGFDHRDRRRAVGRGAGHGLPLRVFDMDLEIYRVKVSYHQKPSRRINMDLRLAEGPDRHPRTLIASCSSFNPRWSRCVITG